MLAPVNHIMPLATVERERVLPISGNVLAKLNQSVSPTDVIAEAIWSREHVLIDVARKLGISANEADRLIRVKVGDKISEGTEVAVSKGFISRALRSPKDGNVVAAGAGQVLLETDETNIQLKAGLPGVIIQIIPNRGALIRIVGALVQGTWGNGCIDTGLMLNLTEKTGDELIVSRLDASLRGSIILTSIVRDADTLRAAEELPVRGLVLSSISPALLPAAKQMRYPIIAIDGFGHMPMNSAAYKLLTSNAKREATINAEAFNRHTGARPEIIIPLPVSQEPPLPKDIDTLEPGQTVRLRRAPHAGTVGTLTSLRSGLSTMPSGLRARAADVKLDNGEKIVVPLVNLEIVG